MPPTPAFRRTAEAIRFLRAQAQPDLGALARHLALDPAVVRRDFKRLVGIGPKRFVQDLVARRAAGLLDRGADVLDASLEAGLSGPGRLHDLMVRVEAMSPGEWKRGGAALGVGWGHGMTPIGPAAVAWTARGIHRLEFVDDPAAVEAFAAALSRRVPEAEIRRDDAGAEHHLAAAFAAGTTGEPIRLHLVATPFQLAVWRALLRLPVGTTTTYRAMAAAMDRPGASRAVAGAVAANPVAVLIPCHRVLRSDGGLSGYRWGCARKLALLCREEGCPVERSDDAAAAAARGDG